MKKIMLPVMVAGLVISPISTIVSCGHAPIYNELTEQVYNEALNQFVGNDWKGGICSIPHPSFNLNAIRDYLKNVLAKWNITPIQDIYGNLWYDIPASEGCEEWKKIVLQGHMDMVWTLKEGETEVKNPIPVLDVDDKGEPIIHTKDYKSSLGADDGTGISTMLAITALKDKFQHGTIRCIFTADEEPGLVGAANIGWVETENGKQWINPVNHEEGWDYLINIDGEQEEEIFVSCAGGYSRKYVNNTFSGSTIELSGDYTDYRLIISGGQGGHSGVAIKDNLCNTIKIGAEILAHINETLLKPDGSPLLNLISINCYETANNVVPKSLEVRFACLNGEVLKSIWKYINDLEEQIHIEHPKESKLKIELHTLSYQEPIEALTSEASTGIINWISDTYYGLYAKDIDDRPISSSNVCPVSLDLTKTGTEDKPQFYSQFYSRSENMNDLQYFKDLATSNYQKLQKIVTSMEDVPVCDYEPYIYKENDSIREQVVKSFINLNINPVLSRVHGGIECAWWYKYNPEINQCSIGPTTPDVHRPQETLYLNSWKKIISAVLDAIQAMENI